MKFELENRYQISVAESSDALESIAVLYMPLIGSQAAALFSLLYTEGSKGAGINTIERLCTLSGLNIDELQRESERLERNNLLKTAVRRSDSQIRFELQRVLSFSEFFESEVYSRAYLAKVGQKQYDITVSSYLQPKGDDSDFVDVSASIDISGFGNWNEENEGTYRKLKALHQQVTSGQMPVSFDSDLFARQKEVKMIFYNRQPIEAQTLQTIAEIATMFSISEKEMVTIIGKSVSDDGILDSADLYERCLRYNSARKREVQQLDYRMSPIEFLQMKQGGAPVVLASRQLLDRLVGEMNLPAEVVNVLVEYVLETKNNSLPRNYVEAIASTWMRNGIDSEKKAREALEKENRPTRKKNTSLPDYSAEEMQTDDVDIEELRKKMFREEK